MKLLALSALLFTNGVFTDEYIVWTTNYPCLTNNTELWKPDPALLQLSLWNIQRKTNQWGIDYTATNLIVEVTHEPIVTKSNGAWFIRFKAK